MTMKNKGRNTQGMSEWDQQVCAHLDDLWNKHHSGEILTEDADVVHARLYAMIREASNQQKMEREKAFSQSHSHAV